jgi:inorganic triphosphatase YgiF
MGDHLEIERKFDVDPGFVLPGFGDVPGCTHVADPVRYHLEATYYDTPDLRLAAHRITLRRRVGGADEGWHLKLPAGQDARLEMHADLAGSGPGDVPARLAARVAEVTAGAALAPIAVLVTERAVLTLSGAAGPAAEVADDQVTARRLPDGEPVSWREIEVEVSEPAPALLAAAGKLLREAGARPSGSGSKLARLLGG